MFRSFPCFFAALLATGCTCSETDFVFPSGVTDPEPAASADIGSWLSMQTAPDGNRLTVAYYDRDNGALGFAVGTVLADGTVAWNHEPVDGYKGDDGLDRGDRGMYASHAIAPDGTVWVAYYDVQNGGLWAGHRVGGPTWENASVDVGGGDAGRWASLALDADGHPVVAHHDGDAGTLRVSRYDGTGWTSETAFTGDEVTTTDPETGEPVTRAANVGTYARLLIHEGVEYIAFYDAAAQSLNLVEGTLGSYTHTVVDDAGDVGQWPSMWTDGTTLLVAYHDVANQNLKLATRTGGSWVQEVVDRGDYRGADTEVFKREGATAVVYFDGYDNNMMLATRSAEGWDLEMVGGDEGAVGFHNEIALAGGTIWAGSYDFTARDIFVARLDP